MKTCIQKIIITIIATVLSAFFIYIFKEIFIKLKKFVKVNYEYKKIEIEKYKTEQLIKKREEFIELYLKPSFEFIEGGCYGNFYLAKKNKRFFNFFNIELKELSETEYYFLYTITQTRKREEQAILGKQLDKFLQPNEYKKPNNIQYYKIINIENFFNEIKYGKHDIKIEEFLKQQHNDHL